MENLHLQQLAFHYTQQKSLELQVQEIKPLVLSGPSGKYFTAKGSPSVQV